MSKSFSWPGEWLPPPPRPNPRSSGGCFHHASHHAVGAAMSAPQDPGSPEFDAQWNYVAATAVGLQQASAVFREALADARTHGLSVADLVRASGWDEETVRILLLGVTP